MRESLKIVKKWSKDILPAWRQKKIADEMDEEIRCQINEAEQESFYIRCRQGGR